MSKSPKNSKKSDINESREVQSEDVYERRDILKTAGAGVSAVAIAGCQSVGNGNNGGGPNNSAQEESDDVPSDLFEGETIKIGGIYPHPGDYVVGTAAKNAGELANAEINADGGLLGGEVDQIIRNSNIAPGPSRENASELTFDEQVDMLLGGFLDTSFMQMVEAPASRGDLISFYPGSGAISVSEMRDSNYDRYNFTFKASVNLLHALWSEAYLLQDLTEIYGWDSMVAFTENLQIFDPFGQPFFDVIEEMDFIDIVEASRSSTSITDWNPLFDQAEEAGVDLFCANLVLTGTTAARQWGNQERPFIFGGTHVDGMDPGFWDSVGRVSPGLFTINVGSQDSRQTPRTIPMIDRFEERFGYRMNAFIGYNVYDAHNYWFDAVKKTGSMHPDDIRPYFLDRVFEGGTTCRQQEYTGPDPGEPDRYSHEYVWRGYRERDGKEGWDWEGWLPFNQWQSEGGQKGTPAQMVTMGPPRAAGGEYNVQWADWLPYDD